MTRRVSDDDLVERERQERRRRVWEKEAACLGMDTAVFYPDTYAVTTDEVKEILAVCAECPVRSQCLEYAMQIEDSDPMQYRWGIWGGKTPNQRRKIYRRRMKDQPGRAIGVPITPTFDISDELIREVERVQELVERAQGLDTR